MKFFKTALLVWLLLVIVFTSAFLFIGSRVESIVWHQHLGNHLLLSALITCPVALLVWLFGLRRGVRVHAEQVTQAVGAQPFLKGVAEFRYLENYWQPIKIVIWLLPLEFVLGLDIYQGFRQGDEAKDSWLISGLMFLILLPVLSGWVVVLKITLTGGIPVRVTDTHIEFPVFRLMRYTMIRLALAELTFVSIMGRRVGHRSLCFGSPNKRYVLIESQSSQMDFMQMYLILQQRTGQHTAVELAKIT